MRIVVIDDNRDDRLIAVRVLKDAFANAALLEAADENALNAALEGGADLVITDYALRWTTGIDVIDIVGKRLPGVPVIMFTNTGSEETAARALRHGVADYVIKRAGQFSQLVTAARNAITQRELRARVDALLQQEREARMEAERASRLREEFLATLSHELRTPLHAVVGWVTLLRKGAVKPEELPTAYEVLDRNVRAQVRLIDDLLDLSRIASGKLPLEKQFVPLAQLIQEVVQEMRPLAASKSVLLSPFVDEYHGVVHADAARLRQALRNLLSNAIKFSRQDSMVDIRARRTESQVEISVIDHGAGIAPEFIPQLFERFRQADGTTTRSAGGMGIGLSIAKHIVEAHGGTMSAMSEGVGKGATFSVKLPMPALEADAAGPEQRAQPSPSLLGVHVLIVDDDPDALDVMRRALELGEASVQTAASAQQGLQILKAHRTHVLVADIGMPTEDGYSLIRKVRELGGGVRAVPAIALTAFARPEDHQRALLAGFNAHIGKPVDAGQLIRSVASLVSRHKSGA